MARRKYQLLSQMLVSLYSFSVRRRPLGQVVFRRVMERAVLEEMLTGHWSGVAGAIFRRLSIEEDEINVPLTLVFFRDRRRLSYLHLVEQVCWVRFSASAG